MFSNNIASLHLQRSFSFIHARSQRAELPIEGSARRSINTQIRSRERASLDLYKKRNCAAGHVGRCIGRTRNWGKKNREPRSYSHFAWAYACAIFKSAHSEYGSLKLPVLLFFSCYECVGTAWSTSNALDFIWRTRDCFSSRSGFCFFFARRGCIWARCLDCGSVCRLVLQGFFVWWMVEVDFDVEDVLTAEALIRTGVIFLWRGGLITQAWGETELYWCRLLYYSDVIILHGWYLFFTNERTYSKFDFWINHSLILLFVFLKYWRTNVYIYL